MKMMDMTPERRAAMEAAGAVETTVEEVFDLSKAEAEVVRFRADLARQVRELRQGRGLNQREAAKLLKIAQARMPLIEGGRASLDAIVTSFLILGGKLDGSKKTDPQPTKVRKRRVPLSTGKFRRPQFMVASKRKRAWNK